MFHPVRPFINPINQYQDRLSTGTTIPKDAVNLSYYHSPPLTPTENIVFAHNGLYIIENVTQQQEVIAWACEDNCLKICEKWCIKGLDIPCNAACTVICLEDNTSIDIEDPTTWQKAIYSEYLDITNRFGGPNGDVPLYNAYVFRNLHYDKLGLINVFEDEYEYTGSNIDITDINDNPLPLEYVYKICVRKAICPSEDLRLISKYKSLFIVTVYTNFQIENNFVVKAKYNACSSDDNDFTVSLLPNYVEYINPQPFCDKATSQSEAMHEFRTYYMERDETIFKSSNVYMQGNFTDPRNPIELDVKATVVFTDGYGYTRPTVTLLLENILLFNYDSAVLNEIDLFENKRQIISFIIENNKLKPATVLELIEDQGLVNSLTLGLGAISVQLEIISASHHGETIELVTQPDGNGFIYARTSYDTGKVGAVTNSKYKCFDGRIYTGYSLRFKDRQPILCDFPREDGSMENWFLRVRCGHFYIRMPMDSYGNYVTRHYYLSEHMRQRYDLELGRPYKRITGERPKVLSQHEIMVKNTPLYIKLDENHRPTVDVYKLDVAGNKWFLNVVTWNMNTGIITLMDYVSEIDDIYVDYIFEEYYYVYKGSMQYNPDIFNTEEEHPYDFANLDVCPNRHHYCIEYTMEYNTETGEQRRSFREIPSFHLLNKIVYIYIKPALIVYDSVYPMVYNQETIFHTFNALPEELCDNEGFILISKVYIRPNSSIYGLQSIDTRTRGGGILVSISDALRQELEIESDYYWDIGYWDGEAYPENAILVVRLDKRILKQHGGVLTEAEVERKVYKHVAQGVFILIEYVTADRYFEIKNLEVEVETLGKLDFKPYIWVKSPLEYQPEIFIVTQEIEPYDPDTAILYVKTESLPDIPWIIVTQS